VIKNQIVSPDSGAFEWAGDDLHSVFCQPRRVFDLDVAYVVQYHAFQKW